MPPLPLRYAYPALTSYWSIALYGANSDNFFVLNDGKANGAPVDLWLVSEGANPTDHPVLADSQV